MTRPHTDPDTDAQDEKPKGLLAGRAGRIGAALLIGLIGAGLASVEIYDRLTNIHEVDARISADLVTMSSRVAGWVTHLGVTEGDRITPGQILVTIDSRETELKLEEVAARLKTTEAERRRTLSERDLVDQETAARVASEEARLSAARVAVSSLDPQLALAKREMERAKNLFEKRVSSRRQLDQAETELTKIEREYRLAQAELRSMQANLMEARAERTRLAVLDSELAIFSHRRAELEAQRDELRLDLEDRTIRSQITGIVDATFVAAGEYVSEGQRLVLVHDPASVWIDANIKETQIRKIKVGDPVHVSVDAYPGRQFTANVDVIGSSTTAEFALLPSPNPSGNFTKITQRLPVRIAIDQQDDLLRPGMMVEIKINTSNSASDTPGTSLGQ